MGEFVIRILADAGGRPTEHAGRYVMKYDPDFKGGLGFVGTTLDRSEALRFPSHSEAWQCWNSVSKVRPRRDDGRPNKPMTSYTVMVEPYEGEISPKAP
jgi:hypothetical protein